MTLNVNVDDTHEGNKVRLYISNKNEDGTNKPGRINIYDNDVLIDTVYVDNTPTILVEDNLSGGVLGGNYTVEGSVVYDEGVVDGGSIEVVHDGVVIDTIPVVDGEFSYDYFLSRAPLDSIELHYTGYDDVGEATKTILFNVGGPITMTVGTYSLLDGYYQMSGASDTGYYTEQLDMTKNYKVTFKTTSSGWAFAIMNGSTWDDSPYQKMQSEPRYSSMVYFYKGLYSGYWYHSYNVEYTLQILFDEGGVCTMKVYEGDTLKATSSTITVTTPYLWIYKFPNNSAVLSFKLEELEELEE